MLSIIILAAGQGKRMQSTLPKVLHPLGGKPLLKHVLQTARSLAPTEIYLIVGSGAAQVKAALGDEAVHFCQQEEQLGTGHAAMQALPQIPDDHQVLILNGDVPLISSATLKALQAVTHVQGVGIVTAHFREPQGLGRVLRNEQGKVLGIIEHKDATEAQLEIKEIYTGICLTQARHLKKWLNEIDNQNAQGEYYLTDVVARAVADGQNVQNVAITRHLEVQGVNTPTELAILERALQRQRAQALLDNGVFLRDPSRIDVRGQLETGRQVTIDVNNVFEGNVFLDDGVVIEPNCILRDVRVGKGTVIRANSLLEGATVGDNCRIGPFARVRPDSYFESGAQIGNFVETKNVRMGIDSKAGHLSYLGDADVGAQVNIGAGTITCNYDGAHKHRTTIGDGAFIGSDSQLIAPVTVGAGATLAAGTTLTADAPAGELTLSRKQLESISDWARPEKKDTGKTH